VPERYAQSEHSSTVLNNVVNQETDHSATRSIQASVNRLNTSPSPYRGAAGSLALATLIVGLCAALLSVSAGLGWTGAAVTLLLWSCIVLLVWRGLTHHPHPRFGPANIVTTARASATAVLAGLIPAAEVLSSPPMNAWLWALTACVIAVLFLDGLDGYLARKTGLSSAMGARFDMEVDSLLALIIALYLWQSEEVGFWIVGLGVMRYAFVLASVWLKPLQGDLYPSIRRKTVCVIQLGALCALLSPLIQPPLSVAIGTVAILILAASFIRDIRWLYVTH